MTKRRSTNSKNKKSFPTTAPKSKFWLRNSNRFKWSNWTLTNWASRTQRSGSSWPRSRNRLTSNSRSTTRYSTPVCRSKCSLRRSSMRFILWKIGLWFIISGLIRHRIQVCRLFKIWFFHLFFLFNYAEYYLIKIDFGTKKRHQSNRKLR